MPTGALLPAICSMTGVRVRADCCGTTAVSASVSFWGSVSRPMMDSRATSAGNSASTP
jgi:hypothetical protein